MSDASTLKIELLAYWHAGTGKGEGSGADALVARTSAGLPYLPGRSVAGLIREAMEIAEAARRIPAGRTETLFGKRSSATAEDPGERGLGRFEKDRDGLLEITSAFLGGPDPESGAGQEWEQWAAHPDNAPAITELFARLSSTALDDAGQAKHATLRTVEVAVPMTLHAEVSAPPSAGEWQGDLETALPLLRAVGSRRSRGFGRCRATLDRSRTLTEAQGS